MAIGGLGGGLLAGLSGIAQGLQEAQKQRESQQLMLMRQAQLKRYNQEDDASRGLYASIGPGALGDVSGGGALMNPMMAGPPPPPPGQSSTIDMTRGGDGVYSAAPAGSGMSSGLSDPRSLIPYITETAQKYGIDPQIALRVARSEGLGNPVGDAGASGGAFQLYTRGGMGNEFQRDTGRSPLDSANERETIDYALRRASQEGWGAWNGARKQGITGFMGINRGAGGGMAVASAGPPPMADNATDAGGGDPSYVPNEPGKVYAPWAGMGGGVSQAPAAQPSGAGTVSETGIALPGDGAARPQQPQAAPAAMQRLVASAPPPVQKEVEQRTIATASAIPQQVWGKMSLAAMKEQIDKANPGADPVVKFMMLEKAQKLLAPTELRQWEMFKIQHNDAIHTADQKFARETALLAEDRSTRRELRTEDHQEARDTRTATRQQEHDDRMFGRTGGQTYQDESKTTFTMNPNVPGSARTLDGAAYTPKGNITKVGTPGRYGPVDQASVDETARKIVNYEQAPMSAFMLGTPFGQAVEKKIGELSPNYDATKFTGKQSGARAVGTRSATLGMAANVVEEQIPLLLETAHKMDAYKTQFPTLNKLILAAEQGTGDENVVRFAEQVNTLKYVYARALNPNGVARVADLANFDAIMERAWTTGQIEAAADQIMISLKAERRGLEKPIPGQPSAAKDRGESEQPAQQGAGAIPPGAIDYLKEHPELADVFDQKYGAGSAAKALGR